MKQSNSESKFSFTKNAFSKDKGLAFLATRPGKKKNSIFSSSDENEEKQSAHSVLKLKASEKEAKSSSNLAQPIKKTSQSSHYSGKVASILLLPIEGSTGNQIPVTISMVKVPSNVDNCADKMSSPNESRNAERELSNNNTSFGDNEAMLDIIKSDNFVKCVSKNTKEGGSQNAGVIDVYVSGPFCNKKSGFMHWSVIYGNLGEAGMLKTGFLKGYVKSVLLKLKFSNEDILHCAS
jgi:hypothetical protein